MKCELLRSYRMLYLCFCSVCPNPFTYSIAGYIEINSTKGSLYMATRSTIIGEQVMYTPLMYITVLCQCSTVFCLCVGFSH